MTEFAPNLYAPWTAEWDDENADWHVVGATYDAGNGITGHPYICTLSDYGNGDIARLIAAAPDLLEALKVAVDWMVDLPNSGDAGFWDPEKTPQVIQARAAIARALGSEAGR